jgi:hypothetical protein
MFEKYADDFLGDLFFSVNVNKEQKRVSGKVLVDGEEGKFFLSWYSDQVILRASNQDNHFLLKYLRERIGQYSVECLFQGLFSKKRFYFWFNDLAKAKSLYKILREADARGCLMGKKRGYRYPLLVGTHG